MKKISVVFCSAFFLLAGNSFSQLTVNNTTFTPVQLVQNTLLGPGVTASNITFNGAPGNTVTNMMGEFNGTASNVGIPFGVLLGTGNIQVAVGPNNQGGATLGGAFVAGLDPDLNAISTNTIYDQAILEFDFIPQGDSIKFQYVFSSEEYNEYVCSGFNDVFGFFISGPGFAGPYSNGAVNIALVPGTNTAVAINTVNLGVSGANGNAATCAAQDPNWTTYNVYYNNNTQQSVQYDGMTVVLTAKAAVQCGQNYHIKLAIGDSGDNAFDSGVFLEAGSFSSDVVEVNVTTVNGDTTLVEGCFPAIFSFTRPNDDTQLTIHYDISGTATNGSDYNQIADSVVFPVGTDTVQMVLTTIDDDATAGLEAPESIIITAYTVNGCGDTIISIGTVWIIEPPAIIVTGNDVILTCPTPTTTITVSATGGVPGYSYSWDVGGTTPTITVPGNVNGTYIVSVTDTCMLSFTSDTINVIINQPPPPIVNVVEDTVFNCAGSGATLNSTVTNGASPITYDWSTGQTTQNINFTPPAEGYVYLTVTDACGEISNTDSAFIDFPDPLTVSASDQSIVCPSDPAILTAIPGGGAIPYSYSWTGGGTTAVVTVNPATTTVYTITITDDCGVTASDNATVTVPVYGTVNVTVSGDTLICEGTSASLQNSNSGGAGLFTSSWDINANGSISNPTDSIGIFTPDAPGYVIVTVTDQCGNIGMDSIYVNTEVCEIVVPNVFSPNGDGINDMFTIQGVENFPNTHLMIFNRWGRLMYENPNYQNNWNGEGCSDGTYYFIINPNDERIEIATGYVTVLREEN